MISFVSCKGDGPKKVSKNDEAQSIKEVEKELLKKTEIMIFDEFEDYASLTTLNEIQNAFGWENCESGTSYYSEGTIKVKHTLVKNLKNNHQVKYVWNQKDPSILDFIEASYNIYDKDFNILAYQTIESNCGMNLGMSIKNLIKWNEKEFSFSGFGLDYEGTVIPTDNSKLDNCKVKITLGIKDNIENNTFTSLNGGGLFNTKSALVRKAPIYLSLFTLYIPKK